MHKVAKVIGLITFAVSVIAVSMGSWTWLHNDKAPKELLK